MKPINVSEFEIIAHERLEKTIFDYYAAGANDELTLKNNKESYKKISLVPRVLRDVSCINISTAIMGQTLSMPLMIAPMAFQCAAHPTGEIATVKAAAETGVGMIVSAMANHSLEEIIDIADCLLWFQLYVYKNRELTQRLVQRAELAGYKAIVVTVDVPIMGTRERDIRNCFKLPAGLLAKNFVEENLAEIITSSDSSSVKNHTDMYFDKSFTWEDLHWLRTLTTLPIILKGIMHEADAKLAVEAGVDAIIVSNHGGRQLDTMPASIEMLPAIVASVKGQASIMIDGGIRRGTDIFKAIALGADCVLIGRPILWGLAYGGQHGVAEVLAIYQKEFLETMTLCGCATVDEIKEQGHSIIKANFTGNNLYEN